MFEEQIRNLVSWSTNHVILLWHPAVVYRILFQKIFNSIILAAETEGRVKYREFRSKIKEFKRISVESFTHQDVNR